MVYRDTGHDEAAQQWMRVESGIYREGSNVLERQVSVSSTLGALYKAGMTFRSLRKYSDDELRFAAALGDGFADFNEGWDRMKFAVRDGEGSFTFTRAQAHSVVNFLKELRSIGEIGDYSYEYYRYRTKEFSPTTAKKIFPTQNPGHRFRVCFDPGSIRHPDLFTGLWFNAYAAWIVRDHLTRNNVDHEVYANVDYKAPADLGKLAGDFDVLASASGRIVLLECKSGRLLTDHKDFGKIADKAEGLQEVLRRVGSSFDLVPLLLFNHHLSDEQQVRDALNGSPVTPIRIDELRRTVVEAFSI